MFLKVFVVLVYLFVQYIFHPYMFVINELLSIRGYVFSVYDFNLNVYV